MTTSAPSPKLVSFPQQWRRGKLLRDGRTSLTAPEYVVDGVIRRGALGNTFGESSAGKTFIASTYLPVCIAAATVRPDIRVFGHEIHRPGTSLILAAEDREAALVNVVAARHVLGILSGLPIIVCIAPPLFGPSAITGKRADGAEDEEHESWRLLVQDVKAIVNEEGWPPVSYIAVDTLAECTEADETQQHHMSAVQRELRTFQRLLDPEAALNVVHHPGHGDKDRERGAYQLRAAADFRLQVVRNPDPPTKDENDHSFTVTIKHLKVRGAPQAADMFARLHPFPVKHDDGSMLLDSHGRQVQTLVVEELPHAAAKKSQFDLAEEKDSQIAIAILAVLADKGGTCSKNRIEHELRKRGLKIGTRGVAAVLEELRDKVALPPTNSQRPVALTDAGRAWLDERTQAQAGEEVRR